MDASVLKKLGLSENEIKIYIYLLKSGESTAYEIGKKTNIYRVHVYDKLEKLMDKGLATHVYKGSKKYFHATPPEKIKYHLDEKRKEFLEKEKEIVSIIPQLEALVSTQKDNTKVEVFKGIEGIKYFLRDVVKTRKEVLITGIDEGRYTESMDIFMKQYFRDIKANNIRERIITIKKDDIFTFGKKLASTTKYRFLKATQFNPTNTFIYGSKVVLVIWGTPVTSIMIQNSEVAETYRNNFEHLWKVASLKND